MFKTHDICSLTDFQRNARSLIEQLRETGRPQVLTVNGRAEIVVQDAAAYQALLDRLDYAESVLGIQRGLKSMRQGEGKPLDEAAADLREQLGMPEKVR